MNTYRLGGAQAPSSAERYLSDEDPDQLAFIFLMVVLTGPALGGLQTSE